MMPPVGGNLTSVAARPYMRAQVYRPYMRAQV